MPGESREIGWRWGWRIFDSGVHGGGGRRDRGIGRTWSRLTVVPMVARLRAHLGR